MNDSRMIEILKAFTNEEYKSFEKFLNSPYLSPSGKLIDFFKLLKNYGPKFERNINEVIIFKKLYPGEEFNEGKIVNNMKLLTKSAEKFLAYNELDKEENDIEFLLIQAKIYIDRKMPKNVLRIFNNIEEILKPRSIKKDDNSRFRRLLKLKIRFYSEQKDKDNQIKHMREFFEVSSVNFIWDALDINLSIKAVKADGKNIETPFIKGVLGSFDFDNLINLVIEKDKEIKERADKINMNKNVHKRKKVSEKKTTKDLMNKKVGIKNK